MRSLAAIGLLLFSLILTSCTITQKVTPVPAGTGLGKIYIQENKEALMEGLLPELVSQVKAQGYEAESYQGARPADARFHMTYEATWRWSMAVYLFYFKASLFDGDRVIGEAIYDATHGGQRFDKHGPTSEKISPLIKQLLAQGRKL